MREYFASAHALKVTPEHAERIRMLYSVDVKPGDVFRIPFKGDIIERGTKRIFDSGPSGEGYPWSEAVELAEKISGEMFGDKYLN